MDPVLPSQDRAPGARRESGRRAPDERYLDKRGKETFRLRSRGRGSRAKPALPKQRPTQVEVEVPITVKGFGELSGYKAAEIIKVLFKEHNLALTPNSPLDRDTMELLAVELEIDVRFREKQTAESALLRRFTESDEASQRVSRPPVVTILGHVDHGKTTLLDRIRATDIAAHEAGGITQHIAASQVTLPDQRRVTFIDTPGHEAFTEMRARGARVTDVVILVVAADDGVMPQTVEAISHARAAEVMIVVAVTKIDKESANVERVKQQLSEHAVYVEGYGGDVALFPVSGTTGAGVPALLEHLALMVDVDAEKFQADPAGPATGTVVEAENSPRRGVLATVLVQRGTLRKGDPLVAGDAWGSVRALLDSHGRQVPSAGPGDPVEITGLDRAPASGLTFHVTHDAAQARSIAESRRQQRRVEEIAAQSKPATVESLFGAIESEKVTSVNLVVKTDVHGSLVPLKTVLERLSTDEIRTTIVHANVGAVNDSDVVLASASNAMIVAFHVNVDAKARERAKQERIDIRSYKVIYEVERDVRLLMEGRLSPEMEEVIQGHAEVLQIFSFSKIGNIAGCRVRDGILRRESRVRVRRGTDILHEGTLGSLRREKEDVREVKEGFECGLTVQDWDAFEAGDIVEAYVHEARKRTLS